MENCNLNKWLFEAPKYTTFRINKLRNVDLKPLESYLKNQSAELDQKEIPNHYFLKPDCLVVERWSDKINLETGGKEVIVDAACAAAVLRGAPVFAPGVMGMPSNCKNGDLVDIYGDLEGKCKRGLKVNFDGKKLFVGTGILRMVRKDLFENGIKPRGIAIYTLLPSSRLPVINKSIYPTGDVVLQNLPSIVCGWVVDAQPHELILDMCAAPGNKTTHLAEMSNDQAKIIALDKTPEKTARIKHNCDEHGITCVTTYAFDATKCFSEDSQDLNGPPFPAASFDKILLDAPCSGLGQRPQLKCDVSAKMLQSYKHIQRKLFSAAVQVLKPGGRLVYSTCTVTTDENEGMVAWALRHLPLKLAPAEPLLGGPGCAGELSDSERVLVQRFGPEQDPLRPVDDIYRDTIGFFIASFTKTS